MRRRDLLKAAVLLPALASGGLAAARVRDYDCGFAAPAGDRLDQGHRRQPAPGPQRPVQGQGQERREPIIVLAADRVALTPYAELP